MGFSEAEEEEEVEEAGEAGEVDSRWVMCKRELYGVEAGEATVTEEATETEEVEEASKQRVWRRRLQNRLTARGGCFKFNKSKTRQMADYSFESRRNRDQTRRGGGI